MRSRIVERGRIHEAHGNRQAHDQNETSQEHRAQGKAGPEEQPDDRLEFEEQALHGKIFPARIKLSTPVSAAQSE